ncbi:unnamed protein product [Alopecurus aequalis]
MSLDDFFIPFPSPLHEHAPTPCARWRRGSHPCLSQLDLDDRASAESGKVSGGGSHGEKGVQRRTLQNPNGPVAVPLRRRPPPHPLPLYKENLHVLPEELKQHQHSQVGVSRAALNGRYARMKRNMHLLPEETKEQHHPQVAVSCATSKGRSKAGWMSKERSTPEDINLEKFADMFKCFLPDPPGTNTYVFSGRPVVLKKRKPLEVRNALRERRMADRQSAARNHAEVALRKYNRANNTKFELVEVRVISIFYEFGGGCIHYNFTAKQPEDHQSADAGSTKLFFSEVDYWFRNENDVLLCCIVGENDAGHCYGCENYQPVVHPSSKAYGGGNSTCIDYPGSDGDSTDTDGDATDSD